MNLLLKLCVALTVTLTGSCMAGSTVHPNALVALPLLKSQQAKFWPNHPNPATQAAQVERETCVNNRVCWTVNAQLKTSSEYGFGFGQTTVAYNADGSEKFNVWRELRQRNGVDLKDWTWENRLDPVLSMRALVLYDYQMYRPFINSSPSGTQVLRFSYAAYNGGQFGVLKDIKLCSVTPNCDPKSWTGHDGMLGVESTSTKSRVAKKGYGQSAFDINRSYVADLFGLRFLKYVPYFEVRK